MVLEFFSARGYRETRGEGTDCCVAGDDSFLGGQGQDFLLVNLAVQSVLPVTQSVKIRAAFFLSRSCSLTVTSHLILPFRCTEPGHMAACRIETIRKLKTKGIAVAGSKGCLGIFQCGVFCQATSPCGAPEVGLEPDAKMKQRLPCYDAWEEGKKPICVEASPHAGLIGASPLKGLGAKHREIGGTKKVEGITV